MQKIIFSLVLSLLFVVATSPYVDAQKGRGRFDPNGSFWILGDAPSGFSDFSAINLNARGVRWLPRSSLQLNNGRTFRFQDIVVKQERFTFTTKTVRGVSYSFTGRFLKGGVFAETILDEQAPVLEGVLMKFVSGKKVAEANLKFSYFGGT